MNLWHVFPESLLHIPGILYLPYLAIPCYLYVLFALFKQSRYRISLSLFLLLSLIASLNMTLSLGPHIGTIYPPLLLLCVMFMPLIILVLQVFKKVPEGIRLWAIVSAAGWLHSLSWVVWLWAFAKS